MNDFLREAVVDVFDYLLDLQRESVRPDEARCDGKQAVLPDEFAAIVRDVRALDATLRPASA